MALTNIIADFSKATVCETASVYQYDHGRTMIIAGTDITAPIEVHFSTTDKGGEAITRTATYENGVLSVAVPNAVLRGIDGLRRDYNMHAYIYYEDEDTGATIYHATVPIKTRPAPADDIPDEDEKTALQEAIEALQHMPQIHVDETETGYSVTITQTDGTTETVYLVDGEKGDKGDTGDTGADGYSPTITTAEVTGGTQVIIMDKNGAHTFIVQDGRKGDKGDTGAKGDKGEKGDTGAKGDKGDKGDTGAQGLKGDKGDKGDTGAQGQQGQKGDTGADGFSPTVSTTDITGTRTGTRITITDATGAHTFDVMNGIDGETPTVEVGGRNLLLDSEAERISPASADNSAYVPNYIATDYGKPFLSNTTQVLTLSAEYEVVNNTADGAYIYALCNGTSVNGSKLVNYYGDTKSVVDYIDVNNQRGVYRRSFTLTDEQAANVSNKSIRLRLRYADNGAVLKIKNVKLEIGNRATDYTQAPEDTITTAEIDAVVI